MAVLFRTRTVGRILLAACRQAGIPVRFGDASSLAEAYPFHLITDSIRLYLNAGDLVALDSLLTQGFLMDRKEKQAFFLTSHPEATRFTALFGEAGETAFARQGAVGAVQLVAEKWISGEATDDTGRLRLEAILDIAKTCGADLEQFLQQLQLGPYTDIARLKADAVSLLTIHASKGLEFPVVFIAGAEEGIMPVLRKDTPIEEERRLFYVALTRAKELLYISHAGQRKYFNEALAKTPSRFLEEIQASLLEDLQKKSAKPEQMRLF
jgi:DNA helicase-2/ATP-dependent DNA helicase PcrA